MGWSAGLAASSAAPVGIAYLYDRKGRTDLGAIPDAVCAVVARPLPAVILTFVSLIALAWCFRRVHLEWLAWRPGRIEVQTLAAGPGIDADPAQLTGAFRERLAVLRLNAPAPVPGTAADGDVLDVLHREGLDVRNPLGGLVSLMRAARSTHAWQVSGTLVRRDTLPACGVTVQVVELPGRADPPQTVWGNTWEAAIRLGADHATARVLPRTRLCRAPWAAWKGFVLPGESLAAFEEGVRLEGARRYDEALDAYYRASAHDPLNMALRLSIGQLQEKLGLYLDAVATYDAMIQVSRSAPRWWPLRYRWAARSQRRRALVVARYRRVVLLGGSAFAEQWRRLGPPGAHARTARDARRVELRRRLRRSLEEELTEVELIHRHAGSSADPGRAMRLNALRRCGHDSPAALLGERSLRARLDHERLTPTERRRLFELRELLSLAALRELQGLRRTVALRPGDRRSTLTRSTLRLTQMCIEVRLAWIQDQLLRGGRSDSAEVLGSLWPPRPERLARRIAEIEGVQPFGRWHEHYNAACACALPLMATRADGGAGRVDADALAALAVGRLAQATSCADSGYVASRRDWLVSEDPDLDGLRAHPRFKDFEAIYFPSDTATPQRPRHVLELEAARCVRDLLVETARRWEHEWHARGRRLDGDLDVHELIGWWKTECRMWDLVRSVARHHRHWPARLELIKQVRALSTCHDFKPLAVAFRRYEEEAPGEASFTDARIPAKEIADRLAVVVDALPDPQTEHSAHVLLAVLERWQSTLREFDTHGQLPRSLRLAALCDGHAALWQRLGDYLETDAEPRRSVCHTQFIAQIELHERELAARMRAPSNGGRRRARRQRRAASAPPGGVPSSATRPRR